MYNCNFVTHTIERGGDAAIKEQSFCMLLKLSWSKFKLECYKFRVLNITPTVTYIPARKDLLNIQKRKYERNLNISP